jgi:hypothetical protein
MRSFGLGDFLFQFHEIGLLKIPYLAHLANLRNNFLSLK